MIFWTLIALCLAAGAYSWVRSGRDSYNDTSDRVFYSGLTIFGAALAAAVVFGIVSFNSKADRVVTSETNVTLKSLGTSSAVKGRAYFLGGGYINEKRVLNYITTDDQNVIRVTQAEADKSTILEDGPSKPYVKVTDYDLVNYWVMTWPSRDDSAYEFHIPAGSVLNDYTVDNK
jgi:hypothetical protein